MLLSLVAGGGALLSTGDFLQRLPRLTPQPVSSSQAQVLRVIDGDTLEIKRRGNPKERVRLIGIDTPESVRPGVAVECGGKQASKFMKKLASGREVRIENDPSGDQQDRYGRTLAYVYLRGSEETLQEKILAAGWADVYVFAGRRFLKYNIFQRAAEQAKEGRRGVWGRCAGNFHSEQR